MKATMLCLLIPGNILTLLLLQPWPGLIGDRTAGDRTKKGVRCKEVLGGGVLLNP